MKKLLFAISIALLSTTVNAQCLSIESILVDACIDTAACPSATEGQNEMVLFKVGATPLTIAYTTTVAAVLTPTWPNNAFKGWQAPGAITNPIVATLNSTIISCGYLKQPVGGVLPANSQVLIITSTTICTPSNSFANLTDTLYVIFQIAGNTLGHFANNDNNAAITPAPTGSVSTRTFKLAYTGVPACSESVTYDRSLLVNIFGTYGGTVKQNDGSTVQYNTAGNPTYVNYGCQAPYIPMTVAASAPASICSNATPTLTGVISGPATTYSWTSNGTGTVSVPTGSLSGTGTTTVSPTYTPGSGESGTVTFTLTAHGKCSVAVVTTTVSINITSAPTPTIASSNGTAICNGSSTVLTASGAGTFTWNPGAHVGTSYTVSPTSTQIYSVAATNTCGTTNATFTVTVNPVPTLTLTNDSICANVATGTLSVSGASTYTWSTGAQTATITGAAGSYTVTGTSASGCKNTASASIVSVALPTITTNLNSICIGVTSTLTASGGAASSYTWSPGGPSGNSTYTVTPASTTPIVVTGANSHGCLNTHTVTINASPTITVNNPTTCSGQAVTIQANPTTLTSYTWTGVSSSSSTASVAPNSTTSYTVSATDGNGCVSNAAVSTVSVTAGTQISVSSSSNPPCIGSTYTLTANGATTYTWVPSVGAFTALNANSTQISVTQGTAAVTFTVSGVGSCPATPTVVTINPAPVNSLTITATPNNAVVCAGNSATLTATGANTYTWTPNITNGVAFTPASSQVYSVTGTDANGCTGFDTVSVVVNSNPVISVASQTICPTNTATLTAIPTTLTSYTWNTGSSADTTIVSPSVNSVYNVSATDANGCVGTATASVNIANNLTITALITNSLPCFNSLDTLTASGAQSYTWTASSGSTTSISADNATVTINPTTATTYTVKGSTGSCSDSTTITINVAPSVNVTVTSNPANATICAGDNITLSANGASTYTWTGGVVNGAPFSPSLSQTYTVTGSDANGCTGTATQAVTVNPTPTVTINASSPAICAGQSATLTASGANTYTWSTTENTSVIIVSPNGTQTYTVIGTDGNSCTNVNAPTVITVTVNPLPTITITSNPASAIICAGDNITLSGNGASTYTWTGGVIDNSPFIPSASQTYTVTGTDANGCTGMANQVVTVNPTPTVTINASSTAICSGQNATLTASGASTYTWSTTEMTPSITVSPITTQTYAVVGTSTNSCTNANAPATVTITVNPLPPISITPNPSNSAVCAGSSATLTASGAQTYTWDSGSQTNPTSVSPATQTTYTVIGTDGNNCSNFATITINVNPLPIAQTITASSPIVCIGAINPPVILSVPNAGTWIGPEPSTATISANSTSISVTHGGAYTVLTTNSFGCGVAASAPYTLAADSVIANFMASPLVGQMPLTVTYTNTSVGLPGSTLTYSWNFGDGNSSLSTNPTNIFTNAATYQTTLTATDNSGCRDTATIYIVVNVIPPVIIIPNIFTPNGDNINDMFTIDATGINDFDCKVYDRWGLLLHEWAGTSGGWDGKAKNGANCTDGTYYYLITYTDNYKKSSVKDGFFQLIR